MKSNSILQIICQKDKTSREIPLETLKGECLIGRKQDCQIILADDEVSSHHAMLARKGNSLLIKDNGSTNGIKVKNKRVAVATLKIDGYDVQIGSYILRLKKPDSRHTLKILNGSLKNKIIEITTTPFRIGSAKEDNDLVIPDPGVSRYHAQIELEGSGKAQEVWLHTLSTSNGTWVEKQKLTDNNKRLLKDGQIINLAATQMTFQNAYAWHVDFSLRLAIMSVLLTLVAGFIGYSVWDRLRPSAQQLIQEARDYARYERFAEARQKLDMVSNARNAKNCLGDAQVLKSNIDKWEKTVRNWEKCKLAVGDENLIAARQTVGNLDVAQQLPWSWNDPKSTNEMGRAQKLSEILEAVSAAEAVLANPDADVQKLNEALKGLRNIKGNFNDIHHASTDGEEPKKSENALRDGLDRLEERISRLSTTIVTNMDKQEDMDKRLKDLETMKEDGYGELIAFLHDTAVKTTGRIQRNANNLIPPLEKLRKAHLQISAARKAMGELDFKWLDATLELPSLEECRENAHLSDHHNRLSKQYEIISKSGASLRDNCENLRRSGLSMDKEPSCITEIINEAKWAEIMKFDAFEKQPPKEDRREPTGIYDEILGVAEFASFIDSVDEMGFVKPELYGKFMPTIYKALDAFEKYQWFYRFLTDPAQQWPNGGKLRDARRFLKEVQDQRLRLVDNLWKKEGQDREAIVSRGAAILLDNKNRLGQKERMTFETELRNLRRELAGLNEKYRDIMYQDVKKAVDIRREILSKAIPGMGQAKDAWSHELQARENNR